MPDPRIDLQSTDAPATEAPPPTPEINAPSTNMQSTLVSPALTALETAVLECIVYGDLFDYPLTRDEILRWLPVASTAVDVGAALAGDRLGRLLSTVSPYIALRGRESIVLKRRQRERTSAVLQKTAARYGGLMGRLPFVRMVAVTGSLAVDNADPGDDLDYMIVTAPGRVWLTRAMLMALGRIAALRGHTLCPNYLLAETAIALPEHDYYTARELLQMSPVAGHTTHARMLDENAWWREFLPNAEPLPSTPAPTLERGRPESVPSTAPSLPRRVAEAFLRLPPFDVLEHSLLARKGAELRRQPGGAEAVFDATMCKGHFEGWRELTQRRVEERMRQLLEVSR